MPIVSHFTFAFIANKRKILVQHRIACNFDSCDGLTPLHTSIAAADSSLVEPRCAGEGSAQVMRPNVSLDTVFRHHKAHCVTLAICDFQTSRRSSQKCSRIRYFLPNIYTLVA